VTIHLWAQAYRTVLYRGNEVVRRRAIRSVQPVARVISGASISSERGDRRIPRETQQIVGEPERGPSPRSWARCCRGLAVERCEWSIAPPAPGARLALVVAAHGEAKRCRENVRAGSRPALSTAQPAEAGRAARTSALIVAYSSDQASAGRRSQSGRRAAHLLSPG